MWGKGKDGSELCIPVTWHQETCPGWSQGNSPSELNVQTQSVERWCSQGNKHSRNHLFTTDIIIKISFNQRQMQCPTHPLILLSLKVPIAHHLIFFPSSEAWLWSPYCTTRWSQSTINKPDTKPLYWTISYRFLNILPYVWIFFDFCAICAVFFFWFCTTRWHRTSLSADHPDEGPDRGICCQLLSDRAIHHGLYCYKKSHVMHEVREKMFFTGVK